MSTLASQYTYDLFPELPPAEPTRMPGSHQAPVTGQDNYYNTTRLVGVEKQVREGKAKKQAAQILQFFQAHPNSWFGPSDVHKRMPWIQLNSVRRSMSDLTRAGKLIKEKRLQTGMFGAPEHLWHLKKEAA
jgi:hypothetical protein